MQKGMETSLSPAVFVDRDGTINEEVVYLESAEKLRLLDGVDRGMRSLKEAGYKLIIVTNQAGVARGFFGEEMVREIHGEIRRRLLRAGVEIDGIYYCPHHPDFDSHACDCRKPKTGMLLQAATDHGIDLRKSYMIGDKLIDIQTGQNAGCKNILVLTGYGRDTLDELDGSGAKPDFVAADFRSAAVWILSQR